MDLIKIIRTPLIHLKHIRIVDVLRIKIRFSHPAGGRSVLSNYHLHSVRDELLLRIKGQILCDATKVPSQAQSQPLVSPPFRIYQLSKEQLVDRE